MPTQYGSAFFFTVMKQAADCLLEETDDPANPAGGISSWDIEDADIVVTFLLRRDRRSRIGKHG